MRQQFTDTPTAGDHQNPAGYAEWLAENRTPQQAGMIIESICKDDEDFASVVQLLYDKHFKSVSV
jgi:hypothetical protein